MTIRSFLQSRRHERLLDCLAPMGEAPEDVLERRLQWAHEHASDPRHGEETRFLTDHIGALTDVPQQEIDSDLSATMNDTDIDDDDSHPTQNLSRKAYPDPEQFDLHGGVIMLIDEQEHHTDKPQEPEDMSSAAATPRVQQPAPTGTTSELHAAAQLHAPTPETHPGGSSNRPDDRTGEAPTMSLRELVRSRGRVQPKPKPKPRKGATISRKLLQPHNGRSPLSAVAIGTGAALLLLALFGLSLIF